MKRNYSFFVKPVALVFASFLQLSCANGSDLQNDPLATQMAIRQKLIDSIDQELTGSINQEFISLLKFVAIGDLNSIFLERFTPAFEATVNDLTQGIEARDKSCMISALAAIPEKQLTPTFEATVNSLTQGMNGLNKSHVIRALAAIQEAQLAGFEETVNGLTEGMNGFDKSEMIRTLAAIREQLTPAFEATVTWLTQGINGLHKSQMIRALANIEAITEKQLTPAFEATVTWLTQGMSPFDRSGIVRGLTAISAEHLAAFDTFLYPTLQQLVQFVPTYKRVALIGKLPTMQTNLWQKEIARVMNEYRHGNAAELRANPIAQDLSTSSHENTPESPTQYDGMKDWGQMKEQLKVIEERALKQEQDAEYAVSLAQDDACAGSSSSSTSSFSQSLGAGAPEAPLTAEQQR